MGNAETPRTDANTENLFTALGRILGVLPQIASGLLGFAGFAYIVGWIEAHSYFERFGASWLMGELSPFALLTHSWTPLLTLLIFLWLGITDLAEAAWRVKGTTYVLRYGWYVAFALMIMEPILNIIILDRPLWLLSYITAVAWTIIAAAAFEMVVLRLRAGIFGWNYPSAALVFAVVVYGLYLIPSAMGRSDGIRDRDSKRSTLPILFLGPGHPDTGNLRLLLAAGENFYGVGLDESKEHPKVLVLHRSHVYSVQAAKPMK